MLFKPFQFALSSMGGSAYWASRAAVFLFYFFPSMNIIIKANIHTSFLKLSRSNMIYMGIDSILDL